MQQSKPKKWIGTRSDSQRAFVSRSVSESKPTSKASSSARSSIQQEGAFDAQVKLLLVVHGMLAAANALSGAFVSVYLWKQTNDFSLVGWFALATQVTNALTFFTAGKWAKEGNKMNLLRLGIALSACFYFIVLYLEEAAVHYVWLLGAVQGMATGLFWLSFNVVYFEVTDRFTRDRFNGWAGLLGSASSMIAPWISGMLIATLGSESGYRLIFSISLGIFVVGVCVSFFLHRRPPDTEYEWWFGFQKLREKGNLWRVLIPALAAQGVREGVFGFVIGILVFIATQTELQLGNYSLITSAVALLAFWITGKFLRPKHRGYSMLIGSVAMTAVILLFFWELNYLTLVIFGIVVALFYPMYGIPLTSQVFDYIGKDETSARHRVEYVVLREIGLNLGRIFGIVVFIAVVSYTASPLALNGLLLFVGSFPIVAWLFMRKALKRSAEGS
ncbi:MFS transporter [Paenibacillus turpanensis]|uniref:MFS transporter n=1 Tax=Paenibacillus turpanensis TaxID=2689078 RepID=UPI00140997C5|nr:MFS transporter [Paenibacillus turpanensis]